MDVAASDVTVPPLRGPFGGVGTRGSQPGAQPVVCLTGVAGSIPAPTNSCPHVVVVHNAVGHFSDPGTGCSSLLSRVFSFRHPLPGQRWHQTALTGLGLGMTCVALAFAIVTRLTVNSNVKENDMPKPDIVPSFLSGLKQLGIPQRQVAQILGCSEALISKAASGERALTLADVVGLLRRLVLAYPELRAELVHAALGNLLADLGCEVRVLSAPPPAAPAAGVVVDLAAYRQQRMAA